jgi:hypothetical protein
MTPGEVQGLQSLAMSQGGSLTINPETGLPEAGILSALLPMVAGFFLGPAGIGLTAMQSAVAVGALGTAATGSLGKGFMMGLGAYGGAGLGAGLTSAGAANLPATAAGETATNLGQQTFNAVGAPVELSAPIGSATTDIASAATKTATEGGISGLQGYANPFGQTNLTAANYTLPSNIPVPSTPPVMPNAGEVFSKGLVNPPSVDVTSMGPNLNLSGPSAGMRNIGYDMYGGFTQAPPPISSLEAANAAKVGYGQTLSSAPVPSLDAAKATLNTADAGIKYGTDIAETMRNTATPVNNIDQIMSQGTPPSTMDKLGAGFDRATGSWEGAKEVWNATPKGTGYGLAATGMSVLQAQQEEAAEKAKAAADAAAAERRGTIRPYEFSTEQDPNAYANTSTAESRYFIEPRFIPKETYKVAKEGGLMSLAVGGPVEEMSAANAMGANTGYPMANLQTPMYANPTMARPVPTNVISPSGDTGVNAYSGEQRMAFGGSATASASAPKSDTKYSYNPETMKYTQVDTTTPAASNRFSGNPFIDGMVGLFGVGPYAMGGNKGIGMGGFNSISLTDKLNAQRQAAQPTTATQTMGGISTPYTPPSGLAAADTSMIPNIQMQPQQNVDRQLGLEAFYPMMEQQLALKGSNLQAQGYANGGVAMFGGGGTPASATNPNAKASSKAPVTWLSYQPEYAEKDSSPSAVPSAIPARSAASSYTYNPATMQYTDNAGKVTGGMDQSFMPPIMMQQLTPEQQIGLTGYQGYAEGGTANGGYSLGSYSDGGQLLRGLGDGVSDSIPAQIGDYQPARLANNEFVIPARIVSEIGNGSTDAGARRLYEMMDRVQKRRKKTVGKGKVAVDSGAHKELARL